jgi:hypothetical protein
MVNIESPNSFALHLQECRISQASSQQQANDKQSLAYSSTVKMEAISSFETSVNFYLFLWRYVPEDNILHALIFCVNII